MTGRTVRYRARSAVLVAALAALLMPTTPAFAACHNAVFVDDPYSVGEAAGSVTITVSNQAGAPPGGTVDYRTVEGTAKAGTDYTAKSGTLNFPSGTERVSVTVPITNDSADEPNQTFTVELSNPTGCFLTGDLDDPATVTINDNDPKPIAQPPATQSSPKPKAKQPSSTPTPTNTATPSPTPTLTSPSPSPTGTVLATAAEDDGGISGAAIGGIIAAVVIAGGATAFWVRRRFLS